MNARTKHYLDKEKQKISEIISFVKQNKIILGTPEYDVFCGFLKDLIDLEILAYDINYSESKSCEINFQVVHNHKSGTAGLCHKNIVLNEDGRFIRGTVDITINSNTNYFQKLLSDNESDRISGVYNIVKTVYHEFAHFLQIRSFTTHLSDYRALRSAKEYLFHEAGTLNASVYQNNHNSFMIENDADLQSHLKFSYLLDDVYDKKKKLACLSKYYFSEFLISKNGKNVIVSRDDLINNFVDYMIVGKKNKGLLMKYPILQKEYTFECKRKTFVELADKYVSEIAGVNNDLTIDDDKKNNLINNIKEMYFEIFNRTISITNHEKIMDDVISILGIETLNEIIEYNDYRSNREIEILKNYYLLGNKNIIKINFKKYFAVYDNSEVYALPLDEFKKEVNFDSYDKSIQEKITAYFIPYIPECGYFLTKSDELLLPIDFFNMYFLPNVNNLNTVDDFFYFLDNYVKSENELLFEIGKRRVLNNNERVNSYWKKIIYDYKEEKKK